MSWQISAGGPPIESILPHPLGSPRRGDMILLAVWLMGSRNGAFQTAAGKSDE